MNLYEVRAECLDRSVAVFVWANLPMVAVCV